MSTRRRDFLVFSALSPTVLLTACGGGSGSDSTTEPVGGGTNTPVSQPNGAGTPTVSNALSIVNLTQGNCPDTSLVLQPTDKLPMMACTSNLACGNELFVSLVQPIPNSSRVRALRLHLARPLTGAVDNDTTFQLGTPDANPAGLVFAGALIINDLGTNEVWAYDIVSGRLKMNNQLNQADRIELSFEQIQARPLATNNASNQVAAGTIGIYGSIQFQFDAVNTGFCQIAA